MTEAVQEPYYGTSPSDDQLLAMTSANSSFSRLLPGMQFAVDSTSLGAFKECPRKYYYLNIMGIGSRGESVHLTFGSWVHGAIERYHHARANGTEHDEAVRQVLGWLLRASWDRKLGRAWASLDPKKTRSSLIRSVVWYLDEVAEHDALTTVVLANGKPAVELSFSFALGETVASTGEDVLVCGHLDRLALLNDVPYIADAKTTGGAIDQRWFQHFTPDNQFSLYHAAGQIVYDLPVAGVIVDGIEVGAGFTRFGRGMISRTPAQSAEWLSATAWWVRSMEESAARREWPQNEKSCGFYGGCPFRGLCGKTPQGREVWIKTEYDSRVWDPLVRRGVPGS
jgi:hypothetical protein